MTVPNPRYDGKPLLRLLELYVLWALDCLAEKDAKTLEKITPNLQSTYKRPGEWHEIIRSVMELPPNMPTLIQDMWQKNSEIARRNNATLTPQKFAEMFVDDNLIG